LFEGTLILTKSNIFTDPNVKAKAYQQLIKLAREELEFDGKIHYLGKTKKIMVLFLFPYLPTLMLF